MTFKQRLCQAVEMKERSSEREHPHGKAQGQLGNWAWPFMFEMQGMAGRLVGEEVEKCTGGESTDGSKITP